MKEKKLYMIGNAHLDVVWLWNWQEGYQEIKATFRSALDRMKEYDDFVFSCASTAYYEWVEQNNPAMFKEIKERVREGRWELVGGWITQPDCNIPCGESFVRQGLYGQRYFMEKFGRTAGTGYNVDSFGHAGTLPQILKKCGLKNYVFMRPMPMEKSLPGRLFRWRAADGSEVLSYRIPFEYCSGPGELDKNVGRLLCEFREGPGDLMLFYGVGNHGGGPTKANIDSIHSMNAQGDMPAIKMSGTAAFFDTVPTEDLPVYQGDLQHHAPGCYSVNSRVKRDNLRAEQCLLSAERWSALAKALGYLDYPATELKQGWKNALFNQFHDILAGTSIPSAYDDSGYSFGEAINRGAHSLNSAVQAISWDIDIPAENNMRPIVVFNPHPWAARLPVELEIRGLGDDRFRLLDENGAPIPAQLIPSEATVTDQSRLLFVVDMPSLGYRTFRLYMKLDIAPQYEPVAVSDTVLENDTLRVEFNSATGGMNHLVDKRLGIEVLGREGGRLSVISDTSDTWSHDIAKFDQEIAVMQPLYVRKLEEGPVRSAIRVRSQYKDSYVTQDFRLYKDLDRVEVFTVIDWREEQTMLKLKYAGKSNFRSPTYEIPYGFLEKSANGEEEPGQGWIDMTGEHPSGCMYGLALANDRKFGYSIAVDEMAITLLKNSVYAHHNPKELVRGHEYRFIERGIQELTYALFPHSGNWRDHALSKRAAELKQRSIAVPETCHPGALPQKNEFLRADRGEIMLTVLKEAEDGDGFILRGVETTGNRVETVISLPPLSREFSTVFSPCEIKTIKIPSTASLPVAEVNMLELPV